MADAFIFDSGPLIGTTCTAIAGPYTLAVPVDAPAGLIVVSGKPNVDVDHVSGGVDDEGFVIWSKTAADCTGPTTAPVTRRSYFTVVKALPTSDNYQYTLPTLGAFPVNPATDSGVVLDGKRLYQFYLNGRMLTKSATGAWIGYDHVVLEYHPY